MNKQDYDKYYQQGGSYVIPVEIFNELFEDYECFKNDCKKYKEEKEEWINLLDMFKNQQKEFIKWLEDYLKLFDKMDIDAKISYDMFEEILQKYKSIIGDDK